METNQLLNENYSKPKMNNYALKWALLLTLLGIIVNIGNVFMNDGNYRPQEMGWLVMIVLFIITLFLMIMAGNEYRKSGDGYLTYGGSFKFLFRVSLFNVLFYTVFMILFYNLIIDYDAYILDESMFRIEEMKKRGMSEEEIKKGVEMMPQIMNAQWVRILIGLIMGLIFNVIYCLIAAAFVKKNPPEENI